jgi:hypothetical protein
MGSALLGSALPCFAGISFALFCWDQLCPVLLGSALPYLVGDRLCPIFLGSALPYFVVIPEGNLRFFPVCIPTPGGEQL